MFALYSRAETSSAPTVYAIFMQMIHTLRMKYNKNYTCIFSKPMLRYNKKNENKNRRGEKPQTGHRFRCDGQVER